MLESQGVVTIKNDYQDIINAIAKVISPCARPLGSQLVTVKNIEYVGHERTMKLH